MLDSRIYGVKFDHPDGAQSFDRFLTKDAALSKMAEPSHTKKKLLIYDRIEKGWFPYEKSALRPELPDSA